VNESTNHRPQWLHYLLLAVFAFVAYWPLSTLQHATKWDSIETYFPFRYFLSDCLRNGEWPLWMPYQLGGYPFYADPQSGAWYPVAWIFCSIAPYTLSSLAIEILFTVFIAGVGMYRLVKSFELNDSAALIAGFSYIACGFFISNAEHLTWVISAAWLPWIFWSYHKLINTNKYGYAILCGLFLFLLLSGGYPAFITVALYLIILFFLILMFRKQAAASRWKLLWQHVAVAGVFVMLSAGVVWSWLQFMNQMSRGAGMSLEAVQVYPFSPRCLDSLLIPFASLKGDEIYGSDVSMRNAYIGLCCLLMLPFVSHKRSDRKLPVIVMVGLLCLAASLGPFLPVRAWLYHYVPMMRLFRFPALFRIFFIIGAIVIAAHGVHAFFSNTLRNKRILIWTVIVFLSVFAVIFISSVAISGFIWNWGFDAISFRNHLEAATRPEHIQLQCMLQLLLLSGLMIHLLNRGRLIKPSALVVFCAIDMIAASALNTYGTIVAIQPRSEQEAPIKDAPRSFPVPDNNVPVSSFKDAKRNLGALRTNTSIYFKTPATDGYNSFTLNSFNVLGASAIRDSVWANPYLYFEREIAGRKDSLDSRAYGVLDFMAFPEKGTQIIVSSFLPNEIAATVSVTKPRQLTLQQNYAGGWSLLVDGKETRLFVTNITQMAGIIPAGEHRVEWRFNPPYIRALAAWTVSCLLMLVAGLGFFRKRLL
jgi:hypothetical protein